MFKQYNQDQIQLLLPDIKSFLWEWHEAIILREIIDELDLIKLTNSYSNKYNWSTAYPPKVLL